MRSNLSGTERKDGRWCIRVTLTRPDGTKVKQAVYARSQRECQEAASKLIHDNKRQAPTPYTMLHLWEAFKRDRFPRYATKTQEYHTWTSSRILARFGDKKVGAIGPQDVAKWLKAMADEIGKDSKGNPKRLSGRMIQMHRNNLRTLLGFARELGWIKDNPASDISLPRTAKGVVKPAITPAMARLVRLKEENRVLYSLWWLLSECGLRPSEALALKSSDLKVERGVTWLAVKGTKTDASERIVPVPATLATVLREREGWLFPSSSGTPLMMRNIQRDWYKAVARAGLPQTNLYQLRKCCLTRWLEMGMPEDLVKHFAGHTDIRLTRNVYQRITIQRLTSALSNVGVSNRWVDPLARVQKTGSVGSK